jgi:hypothetical protein
MRTFTCDICHEPRPVEQLAPFDLLNLTACRPCVRASQVAAIESDATKEQPYEVSEPVEPTEPACR